MRAAARQDDRNRDGERYSRCDHIGRSFLDPRSPVLGDRPLIRPVVLRSPAQTNLRLARLAGLACRFRRRRAASDDPLSPSDFPSRAADLARNLTRCGACLARNFSPRATHLACNFPRGAARLACCAACTASRLPRRLSCLSFRLSHQMPPEVTALEPRRRPLFQDVPSSQATVPADRTSATSPSCRPHRSVARPA